MPKIVIAHRGYHARSGENTLEAFRSAIDIGVDMIELDVRCTRDGVLVVVHDAWFLGHKVNWQDYLSLERKANLSGLHLPRLEEVLELAAGRVGVDIELKDFGYEVESLRLARRYLKSGSYWFTSFWPECLKRIKRLDPKAMTGQLFWPGWLGYLEINFMPKHLFCFADLVLPERRSFDLVKNHPRFGDKPMYVWTVNAEADLKKILTNPRVLGVITDCPARALELSSPSLTRRS